MKRTSLSGLLFIILLSVISQDLLSQISGLRKVVWEKEKIAPGLILKSAHPILWDSIPQNINILIVNTKKRRVSLSYNPRENIAVSKQASEAGAIAAVNAGFFNIQSGGSVTYIRTGGMINEPDTAIRWKRNSDRTGSLLIDTDGNITIGSVKTNSWFDTHAEYPDVLVTGPLLLYGRKKMPMATTSLVTVRHPRTVLGKLNNHKIILLTLDGRTDQSIGMTLAEVADMMISLGCKDALNLDGGGSTTMWISGKPFNGIVNMPCDNKKFDHLGERAVSDILIVK